jgi:hypothetical protein
MLLLLIRGILFISAIRGFLVTLFTADGTDVHRLTLMLFLLIHGILFISAISGFLVTFLPRMAQMYAD